MGVSISSFLGIPLTERASKELGRGTKWCTSGDKDNAFNDYNDRGELYVWRDRNGSKKCVLVILRRCR